MLQQLLVPFVLLLVFVLLLLFTPLDCCYCNRLNCRCSLCTPTQHAVTSLTHIKKQKHTIIVSEWHNIPPQVVLRMYHTRSEPQDNTTRDPPPPAPVLSSHVERFSVAEVRVPCRIDGSDVEDVLPGAGATPPPVEERNIHRVHSVRPRYNLNERTIERTNERVE